MLATLDVVRDRDRGAFVLEPGDGRRQLGVAHASARVLDCRDPLSRRRPLARGSSRIVHHRPQLLDLLVGASHRSTSSRPPRTPSSRAISLSLAHRIKLGPREGLSGASCCVLRPEGYTPHPAPRRSWYAAKWAMATAGTVTT